MTRVWFYELPTATYYRDATVSLSEVLKDAKAAADGVWTSASAIAWKQMASHGMVSDHLKSGGLLSP